MSPDAHHESPRPGSDADLTGCSHCGIGVDPLRAARVRLIDDRFHYFCSQRCAERFDPDEHRTQSGSPTPPLSADATAGVLSKTNKPPVLGTASTVPVAQQLLSPEASTPPTDAADRSTAQKQTTQTGAAQERTAQTGASQIGATQTDSPPLEAPLEASVSGAASPAEASQPDDLQAQSASATPSKPAISGIRLKLSVERLLALCSTLALASLALLIAPDTRWVQAGRTVLVVGGCAALLLRFARWRDDQDEHGIWEFGLLPTLATAVASVSLVLGRPETSAALGLAGTLLATQAVIDWLLRHLQQGNARARSLIDNHLRGNAWRVRGGNVQPADVSQLRPGEQIVVHAGETVLADVTLNAGNAEIYPWIGAATVQQAGPGDFVYAGARLASGQVRATVRWNGDDRHWQRLTNDPLRRADVHAPSVRRARKLAVRGGAVAAAIALAVGVAIGWSWVNILLGALASAAGLYNPVGYRLAGFRMITTVLASLKRGIVFKSALMLEAAGRATSAVFCARGTLLLGEPELSSIDTVGELNQNEVLSLVAGAEQVGRDPVAVAIQRVARAHQVQPDAVRSPQHLPGLGVTAIAASGKPLVVGTRGLMLRERISVARVESRITELEASGRTVLLAALDHRLISILALQDGLRAGARAAVQNLLDVRIEPILLSGDSRETCAALGRTIDIDHVRPDILPADRGKEIERLRSGGGFVAVVGRSPTDDVALAAASVSVALPGPGNNNTDFDIELGNDEVQKAAVALRSAHECARSVQQRLLWCVTGGALAVLAVLALAVPAGWAPLIALVFSLIACVPALRDIGSGPGVS